MREFDHSTYKRMWHDFAITQDTDDCTKACRIGKLCRIASSACDAYRRERARRTKVVQHGAKDGFLRYMSYYKVP